jgi:type I restriction enzyme, S subunit
MTTRLIPIGDCARVVNGFAFDSKYFNNKRNGLPVVRIRDVKRGSSETFFSGNYPETAIVKSGDLLVGMDGEFNLAYWKGGTALLNQRVCKIEAKEGVADIAYLRYALGVTLKRIEDRTPFSTVKHLSSEDLKDEAIFLPGLQQQRAIAARLRQADRLRGMRTYSLEQCEELRRSIYVQFYDQTRSNEWTKHEFGDGEILDIIDGDRGSSYPKKTDFLDHGFCLFLNTSNVLRGEFDFTKCDFVTNKKDSELRKGKLARNDIVLTTRGTLGNSALYDPQIRFDHIRINSGMVILRANPAVVLPEYLLAIINSDHFEKQVLSLTSGSAQQQLPIFVLNSITVDLPPVPVQQKFLNLVARHKRLFATHVEAHRQAAHLFQTLLRQAFSQ